MKQQKIESENNDVKNNVKTETTNSKDIDNLTCVSKTWLTYRSMTLCMSLLDPTFTHLSLWAMRTLYDVKRQKHKKTMTKVTKRSIAHTFVEVFRKVIES